MTATWEHQSGTAQQRQEFRVRGHVSRVSVRILFSPAVEPFRVISDAIILRSLKRDKCEHRRAADSIGSRLLKGGSSVSPNWSGQYFQSPAIYHGLQTSRLPLQRKMREVRARRRTKLPRAVAAATMYRKSTSPCLCVQVAAMWLVNLLCADKQLHIVFSIVESI